jgi:hypothetical protein
VITKAREIDEQLLNFRRTYAGNPKLNHNQLIDLYKTYLEKRADMGEIAPATVMRYKNAIVHFEHFVKQPHILSRFDRVYKVDSNFAMDFRAYLKNLWITPNGHSKGMKKRLTSVPYVMDVVRGLFVWAMNDRSGHLLPEGFINPFAGKYRDTEVVSEDLLGDPDITLNMAVDFLRECDVWQLPLFCMYIFYGLRVSEPCWLFTDSISDGWIRIECDKSIGYVTKGRRGKRLPLVAPVKRALELASCLSNNGLMGQSQGKAAIVRYTHLNQLQEQFHSGLQQQMGPVG